MEKFPIMVGLLQLVFYNVKLFFNTITFYYICKIKTIIILSSILVVILLIFFYLNKIMGRHKKPDLTVRKQYSANIDVNIPPEMKRLSRKLGMPTYKLVEKALRTFIKRQNAFLKNRLK